MTINDYYDYVDAFYIKYTHENPQEDPLLFNRWLTRIRILASVFESHIVDATVIENDDIQKWYNFDK